MPEKLSIYKKRRSLNCLCSQGMAGSF